MIKLKSDRYPPGWKLNREIKGDEQALKKFQQTFKLQATAIVNQIFIAKDGKIQINYSLFEANAMAEIAALKLCTFIDTANTIFKHGNCVIELIAANNWLKQDALTLLKPDPINDVLLRQPPVPVNWQLWQLVLADPAKTAFFEKKFGAGIAMIINQAFKVENDIIRVNYVSARSESETEKLYVTMKKAVSTKNIILKKGKVIIEIIAQEELLKHTVKEFF
jgi:hypothetical protein